MSEAKMPPEERKKAISQEQRLFEEFYLWLEESMPRLFWNEVSREWISMIVHALMGFKVQDYFTEIHLKNAAISLVIDSPEADVQILKNYPMYGIKSYTTYISRNPLPFPEIVGYLRIATIHFTEALATQPEPLPESQKNDLKNFLKARNPDQDDAYWDALIEKMDAAFLRKMPTEREVMAMEMFHRAQTRDHCQFEVEYEEEWEEKGAPSMTLVIAWKNTPKHNFLYRLARVVYRHGLVMRRVNAAYIDPYTTESVLMLSFGLHGSNGQAAWEAADTADFLQELVTLKYFGSFDLIEETFVDTKLLSGNHANLVRTMRQFIHQVLVHTDPNLYTLDTIEEGICRHPELTVKLCSAFDAKFHPSHHDLKTFNEIAIDFKQLVDQLDTGHAHLDIRRKNILLQGMNFVHHTLKTNFFRSNKTAFAFRLDPLYLDHAPFDRKKIFPELPYGIFFIKGMHFIGFHIRFRDLSRGGLRTVYPERKERVIAEQNTVFLECYNLAYTQQKKNKDIPEGGAKGVIFLKPYERLESEAEILSREFRISGYDKEQMLEKIKRFKEYQKLEYLHQTQRSFIKNFLSLINCDPDGTLRAKHIVDYWKQPEYIYLGPDENMHDEMIVWIAGESRKSHYKPGGAFISGKPSIGINHKEYGVTSLGVNIYMDEMLKYLGIHPERDVFTIKMTGGPDGDVAGNQINNLYKFYPNTAKLVALTDISGTIRDPEGLDLETLVKLFHEEKPIRFYPPEKLSPGGFLLDRETRRDVSAYISQTLCWRNAKGALVSDWLSGNEMNALFRNNVHETPADIFVPCGGRPRTLRDTNFQEFLDPTGVPTSKAIIEGANLYLSTWGRSAIEEQGVLIIKDSSANKGGVICSSFEILCGLTLPDADFLKHKTALVQEILTRLKNCAQDEAQLLLETHKKTKAPLSEISEEISRRINWFTDQLLDYLNNIQLPDNPNDPLLQCFLYYCPEILRTHYQDRLLREVPDNHKKAIIASHIAARIVYRRGLKWFPSLIEILPLILQEKDLIF